MGKKKRNNKSCFKIAWLQARQAQRQTKHPVHIGWIFIVSLLSFRPSVMLPVIPNRKANDDWPISDYERGFSKPRWQLHERYIEQPTMKRLMRDLRRPAAREDATQCLLSRINDVDLRGWIIEQIHEDRINRLAVHVRPGLQDRSIIASWQAELDTEKIIDDEAVNDGLQMHQIPKVKEF